MSYPRPWRGKLARIKAVALPMHWLMASFKSLALILRSGRSLRLEGCARGMRRVGPAVPSPVETALGGFLRVRVWVKCELLERARSLA
jgi:hypothetical protein